LRFAIFTALRFVIFGCADIWLPPIFNCASRDIANSTNINQYREANIGAAKYREVKRSKYH
jgi:hypothetical protein